MRKYNFPNSEMVFQDPFFIKSVLVAMFSYVDMEELAQEEPYLFDLMHQVCDEESIEQEEDGPWYVGTETGQYQADLLEELAVPLGKGLH